MATPNYDLSLLTNADGSLLNMVTPEIAAQFLRVRVLRIQRLMNNGTLANDVSGQRRCVLISSLLGYVQQKRQMRSAISKATWAKLTQAQRSGIAKAREAKVTPQKRFESSARVKERMANLTREQRRANFRNARLALLAKYTPEQRGANTKKAWANRTQEERSRIGAAWSQGLTPEERSAKGKKAWAKLTPEESEARSKRAIAARMAKLTPEERSAQAKERFAKLTLEQQSAFIRAGSASLTAEERSARAKANIAKVTPEQRSARGKKAGKTRMARYTPEERSAFAMARMAKSTLEERSARGKAQFANLTPEQQNAFRGAAWAGLTPEQRSARGKKSAAARMAKYTPEQRSARAKAATDKLTPEERSARMKAGLAKLTPEQLSERAKKGAKTRMGRYPDLPKAIAKKNVARLADLKAKAARLEAIENGAANARTSKKLSIKRKTITEFHADWVKAGRPSDHGEILKIAKPHYPKENAKAEKRDVWRDREIRRLNMQLKREDKKFLLVTKI
jgi:hypothetical protein